MVVRSGLAGVWCQELVQHGKIGARGKERERGSQGARKQGNPELFRGGRSGRTCLGPGFLSTIGVCSVTVPCSHRDRHLACLSTIMSLLSHPRHPESSPVFQLLRRINRLYALDLHTYHDLYIWSCSHLHLFWGVVWDQANITGQKGLHVIDPSALPAQNPTWYNDPHLRFISLPTYF